MGCCGQPLRTATVPAPAAQAGAAAPGSGSVWPPSMGAMPPTVPGRGGAGSVALRYRDRAHVLVRGPVTGRAYEFSAAQAVVAVDARDAQSLLRTRLFARVEG